MARDTFRKLRASPNLAHVDVKRNAAGSVQYTQATANTGNTQTGTATNSPTVTTLNNPDLVCFTSGTLKGSGGGAGNAATLKVLRDGSAIATTSGTGALSQTFKNTHTTPQNAPRYQVQVASNGGTATWTLTLSREERWG